jgi:hypothetical protein
MTICELCDHVHPDTRKEAPWRWRCLRAPIEFQGYGFVSQTYAPSPPFELCSRVNTIGECEMYEPRRVAPEKDKAA